MPLDQQDTTKWLRPLMGEAEEQLQMASNLKSIGRYQLEAAIQSVHAQRAVIGKTDWIAIAFLYEGLNRIAPGIGSQVGRAVALAQAGNPEAGLAALDAIPADRILNYQPYWAARGHLLYLLKRSKEARLAWERATGLTDDPALREYLVERRAAAGS